MRMDKLTIKSQEALAEAQSISSARGHSEIQPAHLLRALLEQGPRAARFRFSRSSVFRSIGSNRSSRS